MTWVLVSAGEVSGDTRGAEVLAELKRKSPELKFFGIGGDRMAAAGAELLYHVRDFSFLGFSEILRHIPFLRRVSRRLVNEVGRREAPLAVLVDYPGFNLRLARKLKASGCRIIYYIGPQVWAWAPGRLRKMKSIVDMMIVILPFEEEIYRKVGIPVSYVGHPLVDRQTAGADRGDWLEEEGFNPDSRIVGLLPGSRNQELKRLLPDMMASVGRLRRKLPDLLVLISRAAGIQAEAIERHIPPDLADRVRVVEDNHIVLSVAEAVVVASGTSTLEAACHLTPMLVVYRVSLLTYIIGRLLVRIPWIGLVNVVAGSEVAPEFIQGRFRPGTVAEELYDLLDNSGRRLEMCNALQEIKQKLGLPGAAARAAAVIAEQASRAIESGS